MMGLNANQEDMFSKLEEMRSVITEVNNQFKDPVRFFEEDHGETRDLDVV